MKRRVDTKVVGLPISSDFQGLAPPPAIDQYPIVIGPGLSLAYISSIFRLSLTGYRQNYVDLLNEMLEKDPHAFSVISKRALACAQGRIEVKAATTEPGSGEEKLAEEIRSAWEQQINAWEDFEQHLATLAWAVYYGIGAVEIHWNRDGAGWMIDHFSFIHSRRLSYPVSGTWDLHIWDQGMISNPYLTTPRSKTNSGLFGLRIADYPGKFLVHAPQVRGDYPTREGLGREMAYWMALKLIAARGAPKYLERFASPWPEAIYRTSKEKDTVGRAASKEDIEQAKIALRAMGGGSLASWVHPDTIALDLKSADTGRAKITFKEWIDVCNAEISKAVLGGTLTTEVGSSGGNRSLGETQKKSETILLKQDAKFLGNSIDKYATAWWVRLNFGDDAVKLAPRTIIHIEDDPDPGLIVDRAIKLATCGAPVDATHVADQVGVKLVDPDDEESIRLFPILGQKEPELYDRDLAMRADVIKKEFGPSEEEIAAQQKQALTEAHAAGQQSVKPQVPGAQAPAIGGAKVPVAKAPKAADEPPKED